MEVAPGYVRLRHQLGIRAKFGRGRLGPLMHQVVRQLEDLEEAGESIEFERLDPDEDVWRQMNRRLTLLDAMKKRARGRPVSLPMR